MDMDAEREQLIETWHGVVAQKWRQNPCCDMLRLLDAKNKVFNMPFRRCHDRLGWKSKDDLRLGGICAGTIYRTDSFMKGPLCKRTGKKTGQTVHIEHTVPVKVLESKWSEFRNDRPITEADQKVAYAWLLTHSVTTAFAKGQEAQLTPVKDTTAAFDKKSDDFGLPFRRYKALSNPQDIVWNVLSKQCIDFNTWTFEQHLDSILKLMREAWGRTSFPEIACLETLGKPLAYALRPRLPAY